MNNNEEISCSSATEHGVHSEQTCSPSPEAAKQLSSTLQMETSSMRQRLRTMVNLFKFKRSKNNSTMSSDEAKHEGCAPKHIVSPTLCSNGTFLITHGGVRYAIQKCASAMVLSLPQSRDGFGKMSNALKQLGGDSVDDHLESYRQSGASVENEKKRKPLVTPVHGINNSSLKELLHITLPSTKIKSIRDEENVRRCYYNVMVEANSRGRTSIALPLISSNKFRKIHLLVVLQAICIYLEKYPRTILNRFHIVCESREESCFLKRKLRSFTKPKKTSKSRALRRHLERRISSFKVDYGEYQTKSFFNFNWADYLLNRAFGNMDISKAASNDETEMSVKLEGGRSDGSALKRKTNEDAGVVGEKRRREEDGNVSVASFSSMPETPPSKAQAFVKQMTASQEKRKMSSRKRVEAVKKSNSSRNLKNDLLNDGPQHQKQAFAEKVKRMHIRLRAARNKKKVFKRSTFEFDPRKLDTLIAQVEATEKLQEFIVDEIANVRNQIKNQLEYPVAGPENMSSEEQKMRQLCRISMHIHNPLVPDRYEHYPICELYDEQWHGFMGYHYTGPVHQTVPRPSSRLSATSESTIPERDSEASDEEPSDDSGPTAMESSSCAAANKSAEQLSEEYGKLPSIEEVARQALEAARRSPPPPPPMRLPDVMLMEDVVDDLYGNQIRYNDPEDADQYGLRLIGNMTKARKCSSECPEVDKMEAAAVHNAIVDNVKMLTGTVEDFKLQHVTYSFENTKRSAYEWIVKHRLCYQGLRSLLKRYHTIDSLIDIVGMCDRVKKLKDGQGMKDLLTLNILPRSLYTKFTEEYMPSRTQHMHKEQHVNRVYKDHLANFAKAMSQQETAVCDVCGKFTSPKYMHVRSKYEFSHWLIDEVQNNSSETIQMCDMCRKCPELPVASLKNNFQSHPCPKVLTELNVLERMLIERARSNMKVFYLKSVTDKKTPMKATKGVLVVLPTEIKSTVEHVLNTLPSGSELNIQVRTEWEKKYIVSMPRVIRALEWLKLHNPLYADVEINENFAFTLGENVFFERSDATQADADMMVSKDENEEDNGHLLTQDRVDEQPVQLAHQRQDTEIAYQKYALQRHRYAPLSVDTKHLDALIFPWLHPLGLDGMSGERDPSVKFAKYLRTRLLNKDRRWATNANWLIYMYGRKQQLNITAVQGVQARVNPGTTSKDFDLSDEKVQKSICAAYAKTRGFPQYWQAVKYRLRSHVATFGAPTWFVTLNPNIKGWKDLHELYSLRMKCPVDEDNIEMLIAKDPVIFSRYWNKRVTEFFKNVLLRRDGPLGNVTHFFYRTEYQHRGTQHVHCVLWTDNRPSSENPAAVQDFIDDYVTARLPDPESEKELYDLVVQNQQHFKVHLKTCRRKVRLGGRFITTRCRFGFPRPVLRRTVVWDDNKKRRVPGLVNRTYSLARRHEEVLINDYNAAMLLAWKSNIDVQFIPEGTKDVVNYITAYTTKGEKAKRVLDSDVSKYALNGWTKFKVLFQLGLDIAEQKEVGLLEIVDDLLGHKNFEFDISHVFIPLDPKDRRFRVLRPKHLLKDDDIVYETNWLDQYYPRRASHFKNCSLYNMMTNFEIVTTRDDATTRRNRPIDDDDQNQLLRPHFDDNENDSEGSDEDEDAVEMRATMRKRFDVGGYRYHMDAPQSPMFSHRQLQNGSKYEIPSMNRKCFRKIKQKVGRFYLPKVNWDDICSIEDYYRRLVLLFVPWTDEDGILQEFEKTTYAEVWLSFLKQLENRAAPACDDINTFLAGYTRILEEEAELAKRMESIKRMKAAMNLDEEVEEGLDIQAREVDSSQHEINKSKLNKEQEEVFVEVLESIEMQHSVILRNNEIRKENEQLVRNRKPRQPLIPLPDPIQLFVSGIAGSGKSFFIKTLADEITVRYVAGNTSGIRPAVILTAPTGIAALNINGNTLHALLGIEVVQDDHKAEEQFEPLSPKKFDELKLLFSNVKLIIIDEISMVSNIMLMKIHRRLVEISGNNIPFGGYNIVMFGDLLQLPPVNAPHVFKSLSHSAMRRVFSTVNTQINLWQCLEYREFVQNMRQGEDGKVAKMFERIRTGLQTDEDIENMRDRCMKCANDTEPTFPEIAKYFVQEILSKDNRAMALFSNNAEVNEMNAEVLKLIQLDTITIDAVDCVDHQATRAIHRFLEQKRPKPWKRRSLMRGVSDKLKGLSRIFLSAKGKCSDAKMHGGMPAQLCVAVGSRVMLRRNISIRNRLVNGATGVVTKIVQNNRGEVEWIHVHFDDHDMPYPIKREHAAFRMKDDVMTRSQFPLVVAYGATVHKSQGLTLRNALVRTREFWTLGQFYVAVSRVTSLDGLHFAGFNPNTIKFDLEAFEECNRLRQSRGLPLLQRGIGGGYGKGAKPLATQNQHASISNVLMPQNVSTRDQRIVFELRKSVEDVDAVLPTVDACDMMKHTRKSEAIVIGLIHVLAMMEHVVEQIKLFDSENLDRNKSGMAFNALKQCVLHEVNDVWDLINACKQVNEVNDVAKNVVSVLMNALPTSILNLFSRECETSIECERCRKKMFQKRRRPIMWIAPAKPGSSLPDYLEMELNKLVPVDENCEHVLEDGSECGASLRIRQEVGGSARYLVVGHYNVDDRTKYKALPQDPFKLQNTRFLLVGAVSVMNNDAHDGSSADVVVWYRYPNGSWLHYELGEEYVKRDSIELKNISFFVFVEKPKHRLTTTDKRAVREVARVVHNFSSIKIHEDHHKRPVSSTPVLDALYLANGGTDCFLNAAVNVMFACLTLRRELVSSQSTGPFVELLRDLFSRNNKSVSALRAAMPSPFCETGHKDSGEALSQLLLSLMGNTDPINIVDLGSIIVPHKTICSYSACNEEGEDHRSHGFFTEVWARRSGELQSLVDETLNETEELRCGFCKVGTMKRSDEWGDKCRFHILIPMRYNDQHFIGFPNELDMFGKRWSMTCFVEHHTSDGGITGHFTTWIKHRDSWFRLNDHRVDKDVHQNDMTLDKMRVSAFVYRRLDDEQVVPNYIVDNEISLSPELVKNVAAPKQYVSAHHQAKSIKSVNSTSASNQSTARQNELKNALLLENPSTNCFLIVALNMLYCMVAFRSRILMDYKTYDGTLAIVGQIFNKETTSVSELRREIERFDDEEEGAEHDVIDAMEMLLLIVEIGNNTASYMDYMFGCERIPICYASSVCHYDREEVVRYATQGMLTDGMTLEQMVVNTMMEIHDCDKCKSKNKLFITNLVNWTGRYHILYVNRSLESDRLASFSTMNRLSMFGNNWAIMAFAEHIPGHYRTWIKTVPEWLCISDDKIAKRVPHRNMDLKDYTVCVIVFLKVEEKQ